MPDSEPNGNGETLAVHAARLDAVERAAKADREERKDFEVAIFARLDVIGTQVNNLRVPNWSLIVSIASIAVTVIVGSITAFNWYGNERHKRHEERLGNVEQYDGRIRQEHDAIAVLAQKQSVLEERVKNRVDLDEVRMDGLDALLSALWAATFDGAKIGNSPADKRP